MCRILGAGVVVEAGSEAQALLGKTVAVLGGGMFSQFRKVRAQDCMVFPAGTTPAQGAVVDCAVSWCVFNLFFEREHMGGRVIRNGEEVEKKLSRGFCLCEPSDCAGVY